jgi:putative long chain acyl-CoA synthase
MDVRSTLTSPINRVGAAAQNALEVARFGGLETGEEESPYEVVVERPIYRLRRYFPESDQTSRLNDGGDRLRPSDSASQGSPVVLVPPMMLAAEIYDVSPSSTAVGTLHAHGVDPWIVDFGAPEHEEGGLERNLTDHVLAVSDAVDRVREVTGRDVHLGGYSQGGMFCYQAAALRRGDGLASVITFGSPVDTAAAMPLGIPEGVASRVANVLADSTLARNAVPAWMSRLGFRMLDPVKAARQQVDFVRQLHDREALLPRERQRRFLQADGWVAWPGPALADFMRQFIAHNRMLEGGFVIDDRLVTLADIDCPILTVVGEVDELAPAPAVRAIVRAAPRAEIFELALTAGHFGLVVGSASNATTWPTVAAWTRWRDADEELPAEVRRSEVAAELAEGPGPGARAGYGLGLAAGVGSNLARSILGGLSRTTGTVRTLGEEALTQLPRLIRLDQVRPRTRISLGKLLDEQASEHPDQVFFLFEDRAHTHAAAKHRIDSIVRGLISVGIHQGEHVGVLMEPRPTALTVVAALNRLGAVAVLLRPDGEIAREAELGEIGRVVADPEHMTRAGDAGVQVLVLGGGTAPRDLGPGVVDMERIDPDEVELPGWYKPNPGRARDLAFILFTGAGERTRPNRITNRRWILSALGTASSAALSDADTVYSVTPVYHPSGLMVSLGGAIAGGARIALARDFDPATFWDEVRRYGVTVGSYTWTMLRDLVEAPPHPNERHHPVRLFMGSGMPRGLWKRVSERFAPAGVVEFYASTQGEVVLANVSGHKVGAMGRPLPGSARVRVAGLDLEKGLETTPSGFARECDANEVGVLVAEVDPDVNASLDTPLRGVFRPDDAWLATGDLFRRDHDGDFWLLDSITSLIRTETGPVPPTPVRDALWTLPSVDLAVCFGARDPAGPHAVAVGAVTLREGHELTAADVTDALSTLKPEERPAYVRVVDEIPVTTWYRPVHTDIQAKGVPNGKDGRAFALGEDGTYGELTRKSASK